MKKILTLGLAIAMLLLTLTGCFGKDKEETPSEKDIKIALSVLDNEYKRDNGAKTTEDFTLFSQSKGGDYTFTVTWAVDNASISIVKDDATGTYKVDLPEKNETEVTYTLTATLTCGEIVKTLKYTRVLPVYGVELKLGVVTQPQVGVEYYLGMYQANLGKAYYFAGDLDSKNSFYLATTEDASQSVKVVLEAVDGVPGAYRMYTTRNGAKTYFVLTERSDKVTSGNITLSTECPASYLTFNSEYNTLVYTDTVNNNSFFLGSYNTFATIGASNTTYLADGNFPAVLLSTDSNVEFIPTLPEVPQLSANATAQEIVTALYTLAPGQRLNGEFTLAGVVKSVDEAYSTEYENVTVTITVAGKDIGAYRLKGTGADTLKVGDTVTIKGELTNYSGKFQFDTGSQIVSIVPGTGSGTGTGSGSGTGSGDNDPITGIPDNCPLVEGTGYVLSVRNANGALYFNGVMGTGNSSGRFMGSTNASDAVLVYFEKVATSGYKLYFMNGTTKTYIVMDDSSTGGAFTTNVADATVFLWNTDLNTFVVADPDNARAFGAQDTSTYANMSAYATSNTNGYNFAQFTASSSGNTGTGSGNTGSGTGSGSGDVNTPITGIPDNCPLVEGTGYVLSVRNANGALYFNGVMGTGNSSGRFMGSTNASDAVLVYFEKVATSGYKLYFMNGTTKTYIVMDDSASGGSFVTDINSATVFLWNTDLNTFVVADPDNARAFGAQDTSTYANMSAYATSNTNGYNFGVFTLPA